GRGLTSPTLLAARHGCLPLCLRPPIRATGRITPGGRRQTTARLRQPRPLVRSDSEQIRPNRAIATSARSEGERDMPTSDSQSKPLVFAIDDDALILRYLGIALERAGYR